MFYVIYKIELSVLCEMCDEKSQNKNRMFKKLMKNVVLLTSENIKN